MTVVCTIADVLVITGTTVDQTHVNRAVGEIELACGRLFSDFPDGVLNSTDLRWLKRAVAFQAEMIKYRPTKNLTLDATSVTDGNQSTDLKPEGAIVASMARLALGRLSWVKSRTVDIKEPWVQANVISNVLVSTPYAEWKTL